MHCGQIFVLLLLRLFWLVPKSGMKMPRNINMAKTKKRIADFRKGAKIYKHVNIKGSYMYKKVFSEQHYLINYDSIVALHYIM